MTAKHLKTCALVLQSVVALVLGICFCTDAKWLWNSGVPDAPAGETSYRAERQRPRAQTEATHCCWIPLHRRSETHQAIIVTGSNANK